MVLECPFLVNRAARHAVERVAGLGVDEREVEMAEEEEERDVHQPVVDEDRVGEAEASIAFPVPEKTARDREQNGERGGDDRIELLAGVQPALGWVAELEPVAVVAVP